MPVPSSIDRRVLRAVARAGEAAGRLKTNGRGLMRSPMTPLLEIELLRGAVDRQVEVLERLHARVRGEALRPGDGIHEG